MIIAKWNGILSSDIFSAQREIAVVRYGGIVMQLNKKRFSAITAGYSNQGGHHAKRYFGR